jgi:hypothetical protein
MNPYHTVILSPVKPLADRVRAKARADGMSITATAVAALRLVLASFSADWEALDWPPPRAERHEHHGTPPTSLYLAVPADVYAACRAVAVNLMDRAIARGADRLRRDSDGQWAVNRYPTNWVVHQALAHAFPPPHHSLRASQTPRRATPPAQPPKPRQLMQASLPVAAVQWVDRRHQVRSSFIRQAIAAQLPPLCGRPHAPPASTLLPGVPVQLVPVRVTPEQHAALRAAAERFDVSMAHIVKACVLTHIAHKMRPPKENT